MSSDVVQSVEQLLKRATELGEVRKNAEATAVAHEQAAREERLKLAEAKKELEQVNLLLRQAQVVSRVQSAETAAQQAKADAEKSKAEAEKSRAAADEVLARLAEKEKQLDDLLAKAQQGPSEPVEG